MALINCPECGKEISDKAEKCIHCRCNIVKKEIIDITSLNNEVLIPKKENKKLKISLLIFIIIGIIIITYFSTGNLRKYYTAKSLLKQNKFEQSINTFKELGDYKDSKLMCKEVKYQKAGYLLDSKKFNKARKLYKSLGKYKTSKDNLVECNYREAKDLLKNKDYKGAVFYFKELKDYKDSNQYAKEAHYYRAKEFFDEEDYLYAYWYYEDASDYKDAKKKMKECKVKMKIFTPDRFIEELNNTCSNHYISVSSPVKQLNKNNEDVYAFKFKYDDTMDEFPCYLFCRFNKDNHLLYMGLLANTENYITIDMMAYLVTICNPDMKLQSAKKLVKKTLDKKIEKDDLKYEFKSSIFSIDFSNVILLNMKYK